MTAPLHGPDAVPGLGALATDWIRDRLGGTPPGVVGDPVALGAALRGGLTDHGLGVDDGWRVFRDVVAPANTGLDSDRFLAFIPVSPSAAAVWMDAVVSAANFSAESWLEAAGAVAAEREVIELLVRTAGLPASASGCFMSGGSIGNLSALAVAREARLALADGARELDMVLNIEALKSGREGLVRDDIAAVVAEAKPARAIVKVILETCYLTPDEIRTACRLAEEAGADFTLEAVRIMLDAVGGRLQVKASGGIRTWADAIAYLDLGCTRLGVGDAAAILDGRPAAGTY